MRPATEVTGVGGAFWLAVAWEEPSGWQWRLRGCGTNAAPGARADKTGLVPEAPSPGLRSARAHKSTRDLTDTRELHWRGFGHLQNTHGGEGLHEHRLPQTEFLLTEGREQLCSPSSLPSCFPVAENEGELEMK